MIRISACTWSPPATLKRPASLVGVLSNAMALCRSASDKMRVTARFRTRCLQQRWVRRHYCGQGAELPVPTSVVTGGAHDVP